MAVRKSGYIGKVVNGYAILDSRHIRNVTEFLVRCEKCGEEFWRSNGSIISKTRTPCPHCENGRIYHNKGNNCHERLYERYYCILRRANKRKCYENVDMCKEWRENYQSFKKWALANGYRDDLTIDRIDNSKGYSPENCRWATKKEQANNRTNNVQVVYSGKHFKSISLFAEYIGIPAKAVEQRIRKGWGIDDVAKTPYKARKKWSEMNNCKKVGAV